MARMLAHVRTDVVCAIAGGRIAFAQTVERRRLARGGLPALRPIGTRGKAGQARASACADRRVLRLIEAACRGVPLPRVRHVGPNVHDGRMAR